MARSTSSEERSVNDGPYALLKARLLEALKARLLEAFIIELIPGLVVVTFLGLGAAWVHFVGPLSGGYFLALITFGLGVLIIGTIIYAAYRMRQG
jgi:hypothetical protein